MCPFCDSNNVIYKKEINKLMDLWKCKNCQKEFKLPNKYNLTNYSNYSSDLFIKLYKEAKKKRD